MLLEAVTPTAGGAFPYQMKRILAGAAAAAALSACGAYTFGGGGTPSPSAPPTPVNGYSVVLTQQDRTASLRVGEKLEVVLGSAGGGINWSRPKSSDQSVLVPIVNPAATAVRGVTLAAFVARTPGHATLTASGTPQCSPGQACPMFAVLFSALVTVTS